ncbi:ParB family protein [Leifsonia poae]|uniref:ParB family protein n=1 Tax=Leifsonia poae TaxID=110933 RepID=UPI001CC1461D|nr:hypothetical protein [Leifsonia poae]
MTDDRPDDRPDDRTTITVYLTRELRNRARAAYRATADREGDLSWSDFVAKAVLLEVERREQEHNAGRTYEGSTLPLGAGAPTRRRSPADPDIPTA